MRATIIRVICALSIALGLVGGAAASSFPLFDQQTLTGRVLIQSDGGNDLFIVGEVSPMPGKVPTAQHLFRLHKATSFGCAVLFDFANARIVISGTEVSVQSIADHLVLTFSAEPSAAEFAADMLVQRFVGDHLLHHWGEPDFPSIADLRADGVATSLILESHFPTPEPLPDETASGAPPTCDAGGNPSSGCSYSCADRGCSVQCPAGTYSCCNCSWGKPATCKCYSAAPVHR
jgi:hypothetical protein